MKIRFAALSFAFVFLPATWAQEAAGESAGAQTEKMMGELAAPASPMDELFLEIVAEAREIERLLNEITDKETAERSAELLEHKLAHMGEQLRALEQLPFRNEQDAEALKAHMATLTHISQGSLTSMQRLAEVNAYGSVKLQALFSHYKIDAERYSLLQAEDMPHTLLYGEMADLLEDITYSLAHMQNAQDAEAALPKLRNALTAIARTHHMLSQLVPPTTDEQKEAVRPTRERLQRVSGELKKAVDRLQEKQCYGNLELDALLPQLLQAALG